MKLSKYYRIAQLKEALEIFEFSLEKIKFGKISFLKVLGGQLRAMIVKGNPRRFNPLFLNLAMETGYPLEFYTSHIEDFPKELPVPSLHTTATYFSVDTPFSINMRKFHLNDWLDRQVLKSLDKVYTGNDFIKMYSEKHGGAHYDPELTQKELFLKSIQIKSEVGLISTDDKMIFEFSKMLIIHLERFVKNN